MIFQQKTLKTKNQFHLLKIKPILQITIQLMLFGKFYQKNQFVTDF